jgi:hypothetical protein
MTDCADGCGANAPLVPALAGATVVTSWRSCHRPLAGSESDVHVLSCHGQQNALRGWWQNDKVI